MCEVKTESFMFISSSVLLCKADKLSSNWNLPEQARFVCDPHYTVEGRKWLGELLEGGWADKAIKPQLLSEYKLIA